MAWVPLTEPVTWEKAHAVANVHELSCVSCSYHFGYRQDVQPVVFRRLVGDFYRNYFEDGSYKKTYVRPLHGKKLKGGYVPYMYVPDRVRFLDLITHFYRYFKSCRNKYDTVVVYKSSGCVNFTYSVFHGIYQTDVSVMFDNPLLYYVCGELQKLSWGVVDRGKDNKNEMEYVEG